MNGLPPTMSCRACYCVLHIAVKQCWHCGLPTPRQIREWDLTAASADAKRGQNKEN